MTRSAFPPPPTGVLAAAAPVVSPELFRALGADLVAVLALALLAALWLLVQRVWRRTLPEHAAADEALDVRWGSCGAGCGCAGGACQRELAAAASRSDEELSAGAPGSTLRSPARSAPLPQHRSTVTDPPSPEVSR
jgi:hypothetical protein